MSTTTAAAAAVDYNDEKLEYLFKVLLVGDVSVGKTSAVKRWEHNIFSHKYKATIGVEFGLKVIEWDADTRVRVQLWDLAGQERFGNMASVYYRGAEGALVLYDLARDATRFSCVNWKNDVDTKVTNKLAGKYSNHIPAVLVGNKLDLRSEAQAEGDDAALARVCEGRGFIDRCKISVKEPTFGAKGANKKEGKQITELDRVFVTLIHEMIRRRNEVGEVQPDGSIVNLRPAAAAAEAAPLDPLLRGDTGNPLVSITRADPPQSKCCGN